MSIYDKLTIALPVYKRTDFIKSALDSAVNQSVKCRILIIDNNSPHEEFRKLAESYKGADITYVKNKETVLQEDNFNICFEHCETPWLTILHDDDMLHCQYVEFCGKILESYGEEVGGIMFKTHVGEEEWNEVDLMKSLAPDIRKLKPSYFHFFNTPFPGVLIKRDEAVKLGGFNTGLHPNADLDFWYRYTKDNPFFMVNQEMSYFRISSTQVSSQFTESMINKTYEFRLKEIRKSGHNNALAKLGLEFARLNNIDYFRSTYDDFKFPEYLPNEKAMKKSEKLVKIKWITGLVRRYVNHLSYSGS